MSLALYARKEISNRIKISFSYFQLIGGEKFNKSKNKFLKMNQNSLKKISKLFVRQKIAFVPIDSQPFWWFGTVKTTKKKIYNFLGYYCNGCKKFKNNKCF